MKKLFILFTAAALCLTACDDGNDDGAREITVNVGSSLTQTAYADETISGNGVTFTTVGAWASAITETGSTRASSPDWISISPDHGNSAGQYTIIITLGTNYSGTDRTAEIVITCGNDEITVTVTQKATKKDGTSVPSPTARMVSAVKYYLDYYSEDDDYQEPKDGIMTLTFTYDEKNRITKIDGSAEVIGTSEKEYYEDFLPISYSGNSVTTTYEYDGYESSAGGSDEQHFVFKYTNTINLNEDGYATSGVKNGMKYLDGISDDDHTYTSSFIYTYDNFYYLTGITRKEGTENDKYAFTWSGGNMTELNYYGTTHTVIYNNQYANKANLDLNYLIGEDYVFHYIDALNSMEFRPVFGSMGFYGKRSSGLMTQSSYYSDYHKREIIAKYSYEFDSEGFVTKVHINAPDADYGISMMEIEYK